MRSKILLLAGALLLSMANAVSSAVEDIEQQTRRSAHALSDAEITKIGKLVAALLGGEQVEPESNDLVEADTSLIYLEIRDEGARQFSGWGSGRHRLEALQRVTSDARKDLQNTKYDAVIVNIAHGFRPLSSIQELAALPSIERGILGVEIVHDGGVYRIAPTEMIAKNMSFRTLVGRFSGAHPALSGSQIRQIKLFDAHQIHVALGSDGAKGIGLFRGAPLVDVSMVSKTAVSGLRDLLAGWLFRNLKEDGRMVYKYWPSRETESDSNNTIRQWMATIALGRLARTAQDEALLDRVETNIRYNLAHFYRKEATGHGLILFEGEAKLGAMALAALSIVEHPGRAELKEEELALRKTVESLWRDSGEFATFWRPRQRNDNQNFYPGEALLLWSALYAESEKAGAPDAILLQRFMQSFDYYSKWHLQNRNPAFIPWHTQAYCNVWRYTRDPRLKDFVFMMNDWLIDVMQRVTDGDNDPDELGQFYESSERYGPRHASSTGVYLEGLVAAWRLAKETGDQVRMQRYRHAIVHGIRSVMQLTYKNDVDMFYVGDRGTVRGGVRTSVYNNEVRVDNIQHNVMAMLEILNNFEEDDYRL